MSKKELTYRDVWEASIGFQLLDALRLPFHVRVSMNLAKANVALRPHIEAVTEVRNKLIEKHAPRTQPEVDDAGKVLQEGGKILPIQPNSPEMEAFEKEWGELCKDKVEVNYEVVKLPEKIASTCDQCHHNMDKPLALPFKILVLLDKIVEVA